MRPKSSAMTLRGCITLYCSPLVKRISRESCGSSYRFLRPDWVFDTPGLNANSSHCSVQPIDAARALAAIQEAVTIRRRLAEANPARFEPDLATSLGAMGAVFIVMKKHSDAVDRFKEAVALIRPYAEKWPGSRHEKLLKVLEDDLRKASNDLQS